VKKGETLGRLAAKYYGKSALWERIAAANPQVGPDGAKLSVGMTLTIPPK
jgi:nucleoid-associated protein YgaU